MITTHVRMIAVVSAIPLCLLDSRSVLKSAVWRCSLTCWLRTMCTPWGLMSTVCSPMNSRMSSMPAV